MTLCQICKHDEVNKINEQLISGVAARQVAREFGFNHVSVSRHKNKHLPEQLIKAKSLEEEGQAEDLLHKLDTIYTRAWSIVEKAETDKKYTASVSALKECRSCLELIGKLLGQLKTGNTVNIMYNPEFVQVRQVITEALQPYPEARQAVVQALDVEGEIISEHIPGD